VHAVFRRDEYNADDLAVIEAAKQRAGDKLGRDEAVVVGRTLYLHTPDGYGRSELAAQLSRPIAQVSGTARNWATVTKLMGMLEEGPGPLLGVQRRPGGSWPPAGRGRGEQVGRDHHTGQQDHDQQRADHRHRDHASWSRTAATGARPAARPARCDHDPGQHHPRWPASTAPRRPGGAGTEDLEQWPRGAAGHADQQQVRHGGRAEHRQGHAEATAGS
jgi:hypothetical protein